MHISAGTTEISTLNDQEAEAKSLVRSGYAHHMRGQLGMAINLYRRSIALYPTARAHTFLGWAYSMMGRLSDAIVECEQAIRLDPTYGNAYNDIGAYLIEQEHYAEAIPWLEQALAIPDYETRHYAHMNLGRAYERLGRLLDAREAYLAALAENTNYQAAREALDRLLPRLN